MVFSMRVRNRGEGSGVVARGGREFQSALVRLAFLITAVRGDGNAAEHGCRNVDQSADVFVHNATHDAARDG